MSQRTLLNNRAYVRATTDASETADAQWKESDHPRKGGKFAKKGTGTTGNGGKRPSGNVMKSYWKHHISKLKNWTNPVETEEDKVLNKYQKKMGLHFKSEKSRKMFKSCIKKGDTPKEAWRKTCKRHPMDIAR